MILKLILLDFFNNQLIIEMKRIINLSKIKIIFLLLSLNLLIQASDLYPHSQNPSPKQFSSKKLSPSSMSTQKGRVQAQSHRLLTTSQCNNLGCQSCDPEGNCETCIDPRAQVVQGICVCPNFFQKPNHQGICSPCFVFGCQFCVVGEILKCSQCHDPQANIVEGKCICPEGKYLNGNGFCSECSVEGCRVCENGSSEVCQQCVDNLWTHLSDGKCVCWSSAWQRPNSYGLCDYCLAQGCQSCTWSAYDCDRCIDSKATLENGVCECPEQLTMNDDGICQECNVENCIYCVTQEPEYCDLCDHTHFEKNGDCIEDIECSPGCYHCIEYSSCISCMNHYFLKNTSLCDKCDDQCASCFGVYNNECLSCYPKFYLQNNSCLVCPENCLTCGEEGCLQCITSYKLTQNRMCQVCQQKCSKCGEQCQQCQIGYVSVRGTCLSCLPTCIQCQSSDLTKCKKCKSGYYLSQHKCVQCPQDCKECVPMGCITCEDEYRLLQTGACAKKCTDYCQQCTHQLDIQICSLCEGGYKLQNNECVPDLSCNQIQNCSSCPIKYSLIDSMCEPCNSNANCIECSPFDLTQCTMCQRGYTLESQTNLCLKCNEDCEQCQSLNFCNKCAKGYHQLLDQNSQNLGICSPCSSPCSQCDQTPQICLSCQEDYQLDGWKCFHKMRIQFSISINMEWSVFILQVGQFQDFLRKEIQNQKKYTIDAIIFQTITNGSVKIQGSIKVLSQETGQQIISVCQEAISVQNKYKNCSIIEATFSRVGWIRGEPPFITPDPPEESIVWVVVSGVLATIIIFAIMFICIKKKMQKNKIEKNSEKSENKFAIESENQVNDAQTVNSKESGSSLKSYAFIRHHSNKNL